MKAIIYQYEEAPLILDHIENIEMEGEDLILTNFEGRTSVNIADIMKVELTNV